MAKKFQNRESAEAFVDSLTLMGIREMLIDMLVNQPEPIKPIPITEEQLALHFRIIGLNENRGRPKGSTKKQEPELL